MNQYYTNIKKQQDINQHDESKNEDKLLDDMIFKMQRNSTPALFKSLLSPSLNFKRKKYLKDLSRQLHESDPALILNKMQGRKF